MRVSNVIGIKGNIVYWRHDMETLSALLVICAGNQLALRKVSDVEWWCFFVSEKAVEKYFLLLVILDTLTLMHNWLND